MLRMMRGPRKKVLRGEEGCTLVELLIVVLIVGSLAGVAVPLYLGYARDARLAEAKAPVGGVLTSVQGCLQTTTCNPSQLAYASSRNGLGSGGLTGDGRWAVAVTDITLTGNQWGGGPIVATGQAATNVAGLVAQIAISAGGVVTTQCNFNDGNGLVGC